MRNNFAQVISLEEVKDFIVLVQAFRKEGNPKELLTIL